MSEYQYYEFQAVDRRLSPKEMEELRGYSSRAEITPTRFSNEYSYGDFKGNPDGWVERYFDAFLYVANWGTHRLKLGLPTSLLDVETAQAYACDGLTVRAKEGRLLLSFDSDEEGGDGWVEGEGLLDEVLPVRAELTQGDLRALYLGWLGAVSSGVVPDEAKEPPVPPGLGELSPALEALAHFLRVPEGLLLTAARQSAKLSRVTLDSKEVKDWVAALPVSEKDALLVRLLQGDSVVAELERRLHQAHQPISSAASAPPRTVAELLLSAETAEQELKQAAAQARAAVAAKKEREEAAARGEYLGTLTGQEEALWAKVEMLVIHVPQKYKEVVRLLTDLRDLAARQKDATFMPRLVKFRANHERKRNLIALMGKMRL